VHAHPPAALRQRASGGKTGEPAADDLDLALRNQGRTTFLYFTACSLATTSVSVGKRPSRFFENKS